MVEKNNWLIWSRFNYRLATQRTNRRNKGYNKKVW